MPGSDPSVRHHDHGFFHPLYYPLLSKEGISKTWWLGLIAYVPVIDVIVLRGWRLELVRRMARGERSCLPSWRGVGRYFSNGLLLWTMTALYALPPIVLISLTGLGGLRDFFNDVVTLGSILLGTSEQSLWDFLVQEMLDSLVALVIETAWLWLSLPLYRAAMIRYAVTGRVRTFLNVPGHAWFVLRHASDFAKIYLFAFVSAVTVSFVAGMLLATWIGAVLVPLFTLPIYYWSTGFEYGELARKYYREIESKALVREPVAGAPIA